MTCGHVTLLFGLQLTSKVGYVMEKFPEDKYDDHTGHYDADIEDHLSIPAVADCGHKEWSDSRCAEMVCSNYVNKTFYIWLESPEAID